MPNIKISPSILSADLVNLTEEIKKLEAANADLIHVDVMDGHFVPNLTFGPPLIKAIKKITNLPIEAHLMIENAECTIEDYINAGADIIIIHQEACTHIDRLINKIKQHNIEVGVALNPATPEETLSYIIDDLDLVLVMTVNPGFGGQKFLPSQLRKISNIKRIIQNKKLNTKIEVDGGINNINAKQVIKAGAEILVAGSYIFQSDDYSERIKKLY